LEAYTDSDGLFSIASLDDGHYSVSVSKSGYEPASVDDVDIWLSNAVVRYFYLPSCGEGEGEGERPPLCGGAGMGSEARGTAFAGTMGDIVLTIGALGLLGLAGRRPNRGATHRV
jgi:hypothetical protein